MGNWFTKSKKDTLTYHKDFVALKNNEFNHKINDLIQRNTILESENKKLTQQLHLNNNLNKIDKETIKLTVKKLLENPDINVGLLPDKIEGKMYENFISFLLGLLKESLDTTKIEFLGHEIQITLRKLDNSI